MIGDARNEEVLREAARGRDVVISALGTPASPFREVTLLSESTRARVNAMRAEHVSRLAQMNDDAWLNRSPLITS